MAKQRKAWTFSPGKKPKTALPGTLKDEVDTKARERIETVSHIGDGETVQRACLGDHHTGSNLARF